MALPEAFHRLKTIFNYFQTFLYLLLVLILLQGTLCYSQKTIIPERNSFNGRFVRYDLPVGGNQAATCFLQDSKGFIWIGTYQGLFRFDGTEFLQIGKSRVNDSTGFAGKLVSSMAEDSLGSIWFGTSGGLNCYDPSTGWFRNYCPDTSDISSNNNKIQELIIDKTGTLWLMSLKDVFSFRFFTATTELLNEYTSTNIEVYHRSLKFVKFAIKRSILSSRRLVRMSSPRAS